MIREKTKRGRVRSSKTFVPLYATDAADLDGPVVAVIEADGTMSDADFAKLYDSDGPAGPILRVNGVLEGPGNYTAGQALDSVKTMAETAYTVKPFLAGREKGLEVKEAGTGLLILSLILAAILGGYGYLRKRSLDKAKAAEQDFVGEA
jgi:hypothetical protein